MSSSLIKINIDSVEQTSTTVARYCEKIAEAKQTLSSISWEIDQDVASRRNIGGKLRTATSSLNEVEKLMRNLGDFLKESSNSYWDTEQKVDGKTDWGQIRRDTRIALGSVFADPLTWLMKGAGFRLFRKNGVVYIKIYNGKIKDLRGFQKYYNMLKENLGGTSKWKRNFVTALTNNGVPLYDARNERFFNSNRNRFLNTDFDELNKFVRQLGENPFKVAGKTFGTSALDEFKIWEDVTGWKGAGTAVKASKSLGILGTGLTFWGDAQDNFQDGFSWGNLGNFGIDAGVDIGMGAGATAMGAAIGSFILPPAGTVVGAVAGAGINVAMNVKFGGPPGQSATDYVKNFVKNPITESVELGQNIEHAGKEITKSVENVGNVISGLGKKLGQLW